MNYPLVLKYRGTTIGRGYIAEISATARLIAAQDEDGWWLHGVNPSALAADGDALEDAYLTLRETLRLVLVDFAAEAGSFEEFCARVRQFFESSNADMTRDWVDAVAAVRAKAIDLGDLPKVSADTPVEISVELRRMQDLTPSLNVPPLDAPPQGGGASDQYLARAT
jgi:hypothetical protein